MDHIDSVLASLDLFSDLAENLVRLLLAEVVGDLLMPPFSCRSLSPLSVPKVLDLVWLRVCTGRLTGELTKHPQTEQPLVLFQRLHGAHRSCTLRD